MSPSEEDLRAALRRGEGDPVDVDGIVAAGDAQRRRRRTRVLSTAASVVAVGGVAALVGVLAATGGSQHTSVAVHGARGDATAPTSGPSHGTAPAGVFPQSPTSTAQPGSAGSPASLACPASYPARLLPGGGSPGQFGAGSPLFARPAATIVVCAYGDSADAGSSRAPGRLVLTGTDATRLQQSLEKASTDAPSCPPPPPGTVTPRYAFIPIDASDNRMALISGTSGCTGQVTNGTAVRFWWEPPAGLARTLAALQPGGGGSTPVELPPSPPSSGNQGSPVR